MRFFKGVISWYLLRTWAYQNVEWAMLGAGNVCGGMVPRGAREYRIQGFRRSIVSAEPGTNHDFSYRATALERIGKDAAARWGLSFVASPAHRALGGASLFLWRLHL